eukprot:1069261-Alexandrium_andersonii.AAC.1
MTRICHRCGGIYLGRGGCSNPDCPSNDHGQCSCGGRYLGRGMCDNPNCPGPEGPGRRRIRAEAAAREAMQRARELQAVARQARQDQRRGLAQQAPRRARSMPPLGMDFQDGMGG